MSDDITCTVCNTMDIGTIIREDDTTVTLTLNGSDTEKENLQIKLTELAQSIENEPCEISAQTIEGGQGLQMSFTFGCAAEKMIFDMRSAKMK